MNFILIEDEQHTNQTDQDEKNCLIKTEGLDTEFPVDSPASILSKKQKTSCQRGVTRPAAADSADDKKYFKIV